jgi:hypothetical protein
MERKKFRWFDLKREMERKPQMNENKKKNRKSIWIGI